MSDSSESDHQAAHVRGIGISQGYDRHQTAAQGVCSTAQACLKEYTMRVPLSRSNSSQNLTEKQPLVRSSSHHSGSDSDDSASSQGPVSNKPIVKQLRDETRSASSREKNDAATPTGKVFERKKGNLTASRKEQVPKKNNRPAANKVNRLAWVAENLPAQCSALRALIERNNVSKEELLSFIAFYESIPISTKQDLQTLKNLSTVPVNNPQFLPCLSNIIEKIVIEQSNLPNDVIDECNNLLTLFDPPEGVPKDQHRAFIPEGKHRAFIQLYESVPTSGEDAYQKDRLLQTLRSLEPLNTPQNLAALFAALEKIPTAVNRGLIPRLPESEVPFKGDQENAFQVSQRRWLPAERRK